MSRLPHCQLASSAGSEMLLYNCFHQSPRMNCHWLFLGHVFTLVPITTAEGIWCPDGQLLRNHSTPSSDRWRDGSPERENDLPKVSELVSGSIEDRNFQLRDLSATGRKAPAGAWGLLRSAWATPNACWLLHTECSGGILPGEEATKDQSSKALKEQTGYRNNWMTELAVNMCRVGCGRGRQREARSPWLLVAMSGREGLCRMICPHGVCLRPGVSGQLFLLPEFL